MTKLTENTRVRHTGIISLEDLTPSITIIGAGSIGSFTTLALAKLGCTNLHVFDHDVVGKENIGCQLYGEPYLNKPKVNSLAGIINQLTGIDIKPIKKEWVENEAGSDYVISAVDSLETRVKIWEEIKDDPEALVYFDSRMAKEMMRIYTIDLSIDEDKTFYEKTLLGRKAEPVPCSERSVVYNNFVIAGLIVNQLKKIIKKQDYDREIIFELSTLDMIRT